MQKVIKPLVGRCGDRGCDFAVFTTTTDTADEWNDVRRLGVAYHLSGYGWFARCPNGHIVGLKEIQGTYSAVHKCDSRCLNAKGHTCTCSCSGLNHGRGHAITVTTEEGPHLGTLGKHIVGDVSVIAKRDVRGGQSTLYTFQAINTGSVIKWFVPKQYDPKFETGSQFKIRARVTGHEDGAFGRTTMIKYTTKIE